MDNEIKWIAIMLATIAVASAAALAWEDHEKTARERDCLQSTGCDCVTVGAGKCPGKAR